MAYYRIYPLNQLGRIAGNGVDVICADDSEACRHARHMLADIGRAEVWSGARYVGEVASGRLKRIGSSGRCGPELPRHAAARAIPPATAAMPSWGRADLFAAAELSGCE
jgi:hypothetical protein